MVVNRGGRIAMHEKLMTPSSPIPRIAKVKNDEKKEFQ